MKPSKSWDLGNPQAAGLRANAAELFIPTNICPRFRAGSLNGHPVNVLEARDNYFLTLEEPGFTKYDMETVGEQNPDVLGTAVHPLNPGTWAAEAER